MFEVVFLFVVVCFIEGFNITNLNILIVLFVCSVLLIAPGVYSSFYGAPFVPSKNRNIKSILKLGKFKNNDVVVELGSGDGRIIREISLLNVKQAVGLEYSFFTHIFALFLKFIKRTKETLKWKNFWKFDFKNADVLVCFLMPDSMIEFKKKLWPKLRKGTRVLCNSFEIKDLPYLEKENDVFLYIKN